MKTGTTKSLPNRKKMKNTTKQTLNRSGRGGLFLNALLAALPAWRPGNTRPETPHPSKFVKAVVYSAKRCYGSRLLGNISNVGRAKAHIYNITTVPAVTLIWELRPLPRW